MHIFKLRLALALVLISLFSAACSDEIQITDVESGSYEYWCLVTHGTWDELNGPCLCNGQKCVNGSVCVQGENGLTCAELSDENTSESEAYENASKAKKAD